MSVNWMTESNYTLSIGVLAKAVVNLGKDISDSLLGVGNVVASWLVRSSLDRAVLVRALGPVSRKSRKHFSPGKPLQNLSRYNYRAVSFTYFFFLSEQRFSLYKKFQAGQSWVSIEYRPRIALDNMIQLIQLWILRLSMSLKSAWSNIDRG